MVFGPSQAPNDLNWPDIFLAPSAVNKTSNEMIDSFEVNITSPDATQHQLRLDGGGLFRFDLSACTNAGCGPPEAQEFEIPTILCE